MLQVRNSKSIILWLSRRKTRCNCKGFEYACVCLHSVAVAERDCLPKEFVEQVKSNRRKGNKLCSSNGLTGVGRKGQQQRRIRKYEPGTERKPSEGTSPFTEIWHNNKPLRVIRVRSIPENKCVCSCCGNEFPRGPIAVVSFDMVLAHEERCKYLNRNRKNENETEFLPCAINKLTKRFYCIRKECIYKRFPYFGADFFSYNGVDLTPSHKTLIKDQLDIQIT